MPDSGPPIVLSGTIAASVGPVSRVCADVNANMICDAAEVSARPGSDGVFRLSLPAGMLEAHPNLLLVAEDAQGSAVRFATPASGTGLVSPLTTLVSTRMVGGAVPLSAAHDQIRHELAVPDSVDLFDGDAVSVHPGLRRLKEAAAIALRAGAEAYVEAGGTAGAAGWTIAVADAALGSVSRYLDPDTGTLFPAVTGKTLAEEAAAAIMPPGCRISTPPVMRINTQNSAPIVTKGTYLQAEFTIEPTDALPQGAVGATRIRGRGNFTWGLPKRPYRLNLPQELSLLNMAPERDWALLANYVDKTMMRNAVASCMGTMLGMRYTPAAHPVELTLNGSYDGLYWLTEHIKVSDVRVDVGPGPGVGAGAGFLLEIDERLDEDYWFYSNAGVPYTIKSNADAQIAAAIASHINEIEEVLFSDSFADPDHGYLSRIDIESLIDFYLVNELLRNNDAFFSSTFVHRYRDGKLVFGPLWDFDIAAGNINFNDNWETEGWWVRTRSPYITRLLTDGNFRKHLAARWQFLKQNLPALHRYIEESAVVLDDSQRRNFERWDILSIDVWPSPVVTGSYAGEVDYLRQWLRDRAAWMDEQFSGS